MKGKELDGCDAYDTEFSWVTLKVSGYDTTLPEDDIKSLMREHFSSCGEIEKVYFYKRLYDDSVFVEITGDEAEEKALQLSGSDVGGRSILVEALVPHNIVSRSPPSPGIARRMAQVNKQIRESPPPADVVVVTGFDTGLLSEEKIKGDLSELFSSCGKMVGVCILTDRNVKKAIISIRGEGVADKAWKLSGSDMGGWIADVVHCSPHFEKTYQHIASPSPPPRKKAKRTRK